MIREYSMGFVRKHISFSRNLNKATLICKKVKSISSLVCFVTVCFPVFAIFITGCETNSQKEWGSITEKIRSKYPTVSQLSTEELDNLLLDQEPIKPLLIDTREPEEYAVSHLPGAYLATTEDEALKIISEKGKDRQIVFYCSVGYRSSEMAKKIQAKGFTKIYNLEGSIFKWANEGRELYQGDRQTRAVHPFNSNWKQLLDRKLWSEPME
jgi:rhodanese-related sulfurtransferase